MSWQYIDDETAKEIQRDGKKFMFADKVGGSIAPQLGGIKGGIKPNSELKFDKYGEWINASEVLT